MNNCSHDFTKINHMLYTFKYSWGEIYITAKQNFTNGFWYAYMYETYITNHCTIGYGFKSNGSLSIAHFASAVYEQKPDHYLQQDCKNGKPWQNSKTMVG